MDTNYQYVHFTKTRVLLRTSIWSCRNNNSNAELGIIKWYSAWRQYCFFPSSDTVFSEGCLVDIRRFITQLKNEREVEKERKR